jgi:tetratricopeptide (TPR) repeat protein
MKLQILFFLFLLKAGSGVSQNDSIRYREIDSLLQKSSILDHMDALKLMNTKYSNDSSRSDYWIWYAKVCAGLNKSEKTRYALTNAIRLNNKNDNAYFEKARYLFDRENDPQAAIEQLEIALSIQKKGVYYFYRGIYEQMLQQPHRAINDYDKAIALGIQSDGLYRNYANILFEINEPDKALMMINKAIALDPETATNYITKGIIYACLMDLDKLCANMDTAYRKGHNRKNDFYELLCRNKNSPNRFHLLGNAFYVLKNYQAAINAYTKAITISNDSSVLFLNRGYCFYKIKAFDKAASDYLKALSLPNPDTDLLYDNLSLLYFDQDQFEKSIGYSNKRIQLNPKNYTAYLDRGLNYRKLKKYDQAEADFNTALSIKPDFFRAFGYRAFLYLELNQYSRSLADAIQSVTINPEYGYGYLVSGQAKLGLHKTGFCADFEKAKQFGNEDAETAIRTYCK